MLQNEFYQRTGISLSEEEFNHVNAIYMAADLRTDKDQFCKDWKKHHDSTLLHDFYNQTTNLKDQLQQKNNELYELAIFILEQAEECSSAELRAKAIKMLGIKTYLRIKIERGFNIWQMDKDDMVEILSNNL